MAPALATPAQVSGWLGRDAGITEVVINDAGATEEQKDAGILRDHIPDPSSPFMPRADDARESGETLSNEHLFNSILCARFFCHLSI